jgi:hypothetical protein
MSEELYGAEATEAAAGYSPMPESSPEPAQDSGRELSIRDAANELSDARDARGSREARESPPDTISYRDEHGKRTDKRQTVTRDRAARDLAGYRQQKVEAEQRQEQDLVRAHADALRSGRQSEAQRSLQQNVAPQQSPTTQDYATSASQPGELSAYDRQLVAGARDPQVRASVQATFSAIGQRLQELDSRIANAWSQGQDTGELNKEYLQLSQQLDQVGFVNRAQMAMEWGLPPRVATAIADQSVLEWMQKATQPYEEAYRTVVEKHEQNCAELLGALESVMLWMFPELKHNADPKAVIAIARQQGNHKRADDLSRWYSEFEKAVFVGQQASQRNEQEKREKFQTWARNQDNIFRANNREFLSREHQRAVAESAFDYMQSLGVTREETIRLHDEDILFRSHVGQQVLLDALRWRQAQKARAGLRDKKYVAPTQTLKPGSAETHLEPRGERLPDSMDWKQGARALIERRSKRR